MKTVLCYGDSNTYGYDPRSYFGGQYPAGYRWVDLLAEKLGCPVMETVSTDSNDDDLVQVVTKAIALVGKGQKAPYVQESGKLTDKKAAEGADRNRFAFVIRTRKNFKFFIQ